MPVKRWKGPKGKANDLYKAIIKTVGRCEAEGFAGRPCSHQLQVAHIVTRGRAATFTDIRNGLLLCFQHHRFFHDYPREFSHFITTTWAQQYYDDIYAKSIVPTKVNWDERVEFLQDIYDRITEGELTLAKARSYELD